MSDVYRKPCTSPFSAVHRLFQRANELGLGTHEIADLTGYSANAVSELRRPRGGRGRNPSFALICDIAEVLGYNVALTTCTGEKHDSP